MYYRYIDQIFHFLERKTRNTDIATELTQEMFVKVWQNRNKLKPTQCIKSYLFRAANHLAIDHLRKKITRQTYLEETTGQERVAKIDEYFDMTEKIDEAINTLPEDQRIVFTLSRFDGLKYAEIAETLQISVKTVESRMSKALAFLRQNLKHLLLFLFFLR